MAAKPIQFTCFALALTIAVAAHGRAQQTPGRSAVPVTDASPGATTPPPRELPDDTGAALPASGCGLDLNTAIEIGLAQNPDLITLRASEGVGAGALEVARTYPFNPILQTRILPFGNFKRDLGNTSVYNYYLLWQTFELAHQRRHRTANAAALLDGIRWQIQQASLQNVALTEQLYFTALYQAGLLDLAERAADWNDTLLAVMEKRLAAGGASAADAAIVRVDARTTRRQAQLARVSLRAALLALRRQLNLPDDVPLTLTAGLTDYAWHPVTGAELCQFLPGSDLAGAADAGALAAQLAAVRPDVLAARANAAAARANLQLARASRVPNLMIGPFFIHDAAATVNYGLQAQFEIPVCNNGLPLVHQREAEARRQFITSDQLEAKARVEAATALERYGLARDLLEGAKAETGGELPGELRKLEQQFLEGEIDIVRVSQARNSLLQLRRAYLDGVNEVAQAAAAVTLATGLPPAALVSCGPAPAAPAPPAEVPPVRLLTPR